MYVCIYANQIRRRHPLFPFSTGENYKYDQPTALAHIGMQRVCSRGQAWVDTSAQTLQLKKVSESSVFFSATKQKRYLRADGKLSSKSLSSISPDKRPWYLRLQPVEAN